VTASQHFENALSQRSREQCFASSFHSSVSGTVVSRERREKTVVQSATTRRT
jgi:hypothetical protein